MNVYCISCDLSELTSKFWEAFFLLFCRFFGMPLNFLCTQPCHLQTILFLPSRVYGSYLLSLHHHSGWNFQYNAEWGGVSGHPHFVLDRSLSTKHGANCMVLLVDAL